MFPTDEQYFDEKTTAFEGTTEPGARVFAGDYEAAVDDVGNWRIVLVLSPGGNHVTFRAKDQAGNVAEASVTVLDDVPESDEPAPEHAFTAHQKYGSCAESVPYDIFWGTAASGSTIYIVSPCGEGTTVAGEKGHWVIEVEFPDRSGRHEPYHCDRIVRRR